jgi:hypothetical protein
MWIKKRARVAALLVLASLGFVAAQEPADKPAPMPALRVRLSVTDNEVGQAGGAFTRFVKEGGLFFAADGSAVYVQRGGFGGGLGALGGGGGAVGAGALDFTGSGLSVWNVATQKKTNEIDQCQAAALSPSGEALALVGLFKDKKLAARLVQAQTLKVTKEADLAAVNPLAAAGFAFPMLFTGTLMFAPDGKRVALQIPGNLSFWDLESNKLTRGFQAPIQRLAGFSADGKSAYGLGFPNGFGGFGGLAGAKNKEAEGAIGVWDLAAGKQVRRFGDKFVQRVALAPGVGMIATCATGGFGFGGFGLLGGGGAGQVGGVGIVGGAPANEPATIRLWDVAYGKSTLTLETKVVPAMVQHKLGNNGFVSIMGGVQDLAFSRDGTLLAACLGSGDVGHVLLFDTRSGKEVLQEKLTFCPQAIAFARDGTLLATAGGVGAFDLRVWELPAALAGRKAAPDSP